MKTLIQEESGLTLVEVVVSMLLLSISIVTALTLLATGVTVNDVNRDRAFALNLAEARMEYWKQIPLTNLSTLEQPGGTTVYQNAYKPFDVLVTASPIKVSEAAGDDTVSELVKLEVVVSWKQNYKKTGGTQTGQNQADPAYREIRLATIRHL